MATSGTFKKSIFIAGVSYPVGEATIDDALVSQLDRETFTPAIDPTPGLGESVEIARETSIATTVSTAAAAAAVAGLGLTSQSVWPNQLECDGDSLTHGDGANYPYTHYLSTAETFAVSNTGVPGATASQLALAAYGAVDAKYSNLARYNICVIWAGVNTWRNGDGTYTDAFRHLAAYCSERRKKGWSVIALTCTSASDEASGKNGFNALLRANWPVFCDGLADVAADARIGADGAYSNTTYFHPDQRHLTDTGQSVVADIVSATINAFTNTTERASPPIRVPGYTDKASARFGAFDLQSYSVNNAWLSNNHYFDGSGDRLVEAGSAVILRFNDGTLRGQYANSGAAGSYCYPWTTFEVTPAGGLRLPVSSSFVTLSSPNGTKYKVTVTDAGVLSVAAE